MRGCKENQRLLVFSFMTNTKEISLDFIGIGAMKSGTTWLACALREHPDIFIPLQKEIHYFNKKFDSDPRIDNLNNSKPLTWYASFFRKVKRNQIKGEFSASYLWDKSAARTIYHFNPDIKIVVILRDPVERSFSHYLHFRRIGLLKNISLQKAIKERKDILYRSHYYRQLKRYFDLFPKENIKVLFFEDMKKDKISFLKEVESFLGVSSYIPLRIHQLSNPAGILKFKIIGRMLTRMRLWLRRHNMIFLIKLSRLIGISKLYRALTITWVNPYSVKPQMEKTLKVTLRKYFKRDVENLEKLLDKDLSHWKSYSKPQGDL